MKLAGMGFTAAWIFQFVGTFAPPRLESQRTDADPIAGHGKFEGRAPALFDSLFQSLVLALFFVFVECLFFLGYRPALHKRLQNVSLRSR